jgi:hypothetical protein
MGPEGLRTFMAQMVPQELGLGKSSDAVLDRFQMKVLTEGSGTQIFSTTFAQWTAREALRRAQPYTLLVRFAPRQRQKPMNELLSERQEQTELDPAGSLIDADFGAYYNWINQQRLPGAELSSFLAWFENQNEAVILGPTVPRGTESEKETDLRQLLSCEPCTVVAAGRRDLQLSLESRFSRSQHRLTTCYVMLNIGRCWFDCG